MNTSLNLEQSGFANKGVLFAVLLFVIFSATIMLFGAKALIACTVTAFAIALIPYIYNKPHLFLIFGLFILPFTRLFPLEDKFIIIGSLYTASIPSFIWLLKKYFPKVSQNSAYMWGLAIYTVIVLLNIFRFDSSAMDVIKEFGRAYFAIFTSLGVYNFIEKNDKRFNLIARLLGYMFNTIALVALTQYITRTGSFFVEGLFRARGTFYNFNEYGYVISIFICLALYMLLSSRNTKNRVFWSTTIILNLLGLMTTLSKTSILTTMFVFIVMSIFTSGKRRVQLFAAYSIIGALIAVYLITSGTAELLVDRFTNSTSLRWRFEMWRTVVNMIIQNNWFIGEGANATRNFLQLIVPVGESFAPHNIYLETLYNYGIIGVVPFILTFVLLIFKGIQMFIKKNIVSNQHKIIGMAVITATLITMVQNFVSNAFYDRAVNIIFWAIITILICKYDLLLNKQKR